MPVFELVRPWGAFLAGKPVRHCESKMCFSRCKTLPTVEFTPLKRILLCEAKKAAFRAR
jgi:hypothetical protein